MPFDFSPYRFQHTYILGASGSGKSTALKRFALEDISRGEGVVFFDFHGEDIDELLQHIPPKQCERIVLFDPSTIRPAPINIFATVPEEKRGLVAMSVLDLFRAIAKYPPELSTPNFDLFVLYTTLALLEMPDATMLDMKLMLTSPDHRERVLVHVTDPIVRHFWEHDFLLIPEKDRYEKISSVLNKLSLIIADKRIRHVVSYPQSVIDLAAVRRQRQVLLVRLPQSQFGLEGSRILGRIIFTHLYAVALGGDTPLHVYVDEVHNLEGPVLSEMLSGIRKKQVSLTVAHQYLDQLTPETQNAVLGNCGTKLIFRCSLEDELTLSRAFPGNNMLFDLFELPRFRARLQTPASYKATDVDMPPLSAKRYAASGRKIKAQANERYRLHPQTVAKWVRRRLDD